MGMITLTLNELLDYMPNIGLEDYPIYDDAHRPILNAKILNRYDAREIGFETGEMFSHALKRRMHEIMPYYNKLYESEALVIDPLNTIKMHSEDAGNNNSSETTTGESESVSTNSSEGRNVSYDMPQVPLSGSEDYGSAAADSTGSATANGTANTSGNSNSTNTSSSTSDVEGFQGSQADLLTRYRETFLNIDLMIVERLSDLFLNVVDIPAVDYEESQRYPYGKLF